MDLPKVVEVLDRLDLELGRRGLVHDEGGAGVLLQGGHGPHVAHALLHRLFSSFRKLQGGPTEFYTGD